MYTDQALLENVRKESKQYGDMLILNEKEVYSDRGESILAFKSAAFLHFSAAAQCDWALKTDDDSYVNIPYLLEYVETVSQNAFYGGLIHRNRRPFRYISKW